MVADLPRAVSTTAESPHQPRRPRPGDRAIQGLDPTLDRTFAAYAFSELGMYTAQIVGADGTVLASWPS